MSQLSCESCGLTYSRAAIAREMALATGVAGRRCGGTLRPDDPADEGREGHAPIMAVRSYVTGSERFPFG
jgi:hypothetical protein